MKKFIFLVVILSTILSLTAVFGILGYTSIVHEDTFSENDTLAKETDPAIEKSIKLPDDLPSPSIVIPIKPVTFSLNNFPLKTKFEYEVFKDKKLLKDYIRNDSICFGGPDNYAQLEGVTCFRGNNYRDSASFGYINSIDPKLQTVWNKKIGYIDEWTGVGWNGQPSIVKWDEKVKNLMNILPAKKQKSDLKEVIYATLDGKIYFLDLDNGENTRPAINVGYPHKGSVTVDPRGYPLLYAGQGIDVKQGKRVPIGYRIFSLIDQKPLYFIDGFDKLAYRKWGAFDSTPLIDSKTDTFMEPGENGIFYTAKLNTDFDQVKGSIKINPELIEYRYKSPKKGTIGTENSAAIYRNFIYFADNSGTYQCIDLNTMKPVWIRDITDDTDSTAVIEEISESEVYLYTACESDKQGAKGYSYIRKIDALTGSLVWEKAYKCFYDSHTNGGALASPVLGKNDIKDLVIFNIAKTGSKFNNGKLIALDRETGKEVWVNNLDNYCWSSPVAVYTKEGKSFIIQCDSVGTMFLFEGTSGKIIDKISLGSNIEGSPAVYDDMIVVGTRGQKIWGVRIQ